MEVTIMNDLKKVLLAGIGLTAMDDVKRLEEKLDALLSQNK